MWAPGQKHLQPEAPPMEGYSVEVVDEGRTLMVDGMALVWNEELERYQGLVAGWWHYVYPMAPGYYLRGTAHTHSDGGTMDFIPTEIGRMEHIG